MGPSHVVIVLLVMAGQAGRERSAEARLKSLGEDAARAFDDGEFDLALERYLEADALLVQMEGRDRDRAQLLYLIGCVLEELGRFEDAKVELEKSTAMPLEAKVLADARRRMERLARKIVGRLEVSCVWSQSRVTIGAETRACDQRWELARGKYELAATQPDGSTSRHSIEIFSDLTTRFSVPDLSVKITTAPPAPEPSRAWPIAATTITAALLVGSVVALVLGRVDAGRANDAFDRANDPSSSIMERTLAMEETLSYDARADRAIIAGWSLLGVTIAGVGISAWLWLDL